MFYYLCQGGYLFIAVCQSVCQPVIHQDYSKTTKPISMKMYGDMRHGPRKNPFNLGVDPDKWADPGISFLFENCAYMIENVIHIRVMVQHVTSCQDGDPLFLALKLMHH